MNVLALFSSLNFAKGMDDMASKPIIKANQITYSFEFGYLMMSAMFWVNRAQKIMKRTENAVTNTIVQLNTVSLSVDCAECLKNEVSIPNVRKTISNAT